MKGLNGATLLMWVISDGATPLSKQSPPTSGNGIKTAFLNLVPLPGSKIEGNVGKSFACCVLLENPVGEKRLSYEQLVQEVSGGGGGGGVCGER